MEGSDIANLKVLIAGRNRNRDATFAACYLDYMTSWEGFGRKRSWRTRGKNYGISLQRLRKITNSLQLFGYLAQISEE
jgi:hypothetical protein